MARSHLHAQHFLRSPRLVAELIGHSNIRKNDIVYDLGAGSGVITSALARRCKYVVAVEVEPNAVKLLKANIADYDNVELLQKDILQLAPPNEPYKIFANIPFHLSADVVRHYLFDANSPKAMYLIVQKQFARKLVPGTDHFTSMLSAQVGVRYTVRIRKPLRKTDFTPPPAVDTVLLECKPREESLISQQEFTAYCHWAEMCFSNKAFFLQQPLARAGISAEKSPSQLGLDEWVQLWNSRTSR